MQRTPILFILGLAAACGRSPFVIEDGSGGGGDGAADGAAFDTDDAPGDDRGDGDDDRDEPLTPDESGCGNGQIVPGEICFLDQVEFPSRIDPCAIDIGDLDGDGHLDVAVPNSDFDHEESPDNYASVLYGDGFGGLSEPLGKLAGGDFAVGIAVGDMNGDGQDDLVVTNNDASEVNVLMATDVRDFAPPVMTGAGLGTVKPAVGDLDGDGITDAIVTSTDSPEVRILRGRGDGTFDPPFILGTDLIGPWDVKIFDLDGDADLDFAVTDSGSSFVALWRNDGPAGLTRLPDIGVGLIPVSVTAADVDHNGTIDLIVASSVATHVRLGDGQGDFENHEDVYSGLSPRDSAVADFDNDGLDDLAIIAQGSDDLTIAIGDGTGKFEPAAQYALGAKPSGVVAGDFNEDGVPDLAVSNQDGDTVGLVLSNP